MSTVSWLDNASLEFPDVSAALDEPNGLLAVGGDLSSSRLLAAYRRGIFPWYEEPQPILWWSPDPRAVLFPKQVHVSRSLRKRLRRRDFEITTDHAFADVLAGCSRATAKRPGTWITRDMARAYFRLHREGYAHSVEVWQHGALVGGLYGVAIGRVFYGESMFSDSSDASKAALVYLCALLRERGYVLLDCQVGNPHSYSMGAVDIPRAEFARILARATGESVVDPVHGDSLPWQLEWKELSTLVV